MALQYTLEVLSPEFAVALSHREWYREDCHATEGTLNASCLSSFLFLLYAASSSGPHV